MENRYVIFGAGAIGIAVGGMLMKSGARVLFVARPAFAEALSRGVTLRPEDGEDILVRGDAVTKAREITPASEDIIIITVKSQATDEVIRDLSEVYDRSATVVCLQNGIRNEAIAALRFDRVYAALVFLSAVQLRAELVTMPKGRVVAIGNYPEGVDDTSRRICEDLARAGLEAIASTHTMAMKWGKLIANLNNATHTIVDYWLERGMAEAEMRDLMREVREEGLRVLDAAGIAAEPPAGEPSPIPIRKSTEALRRPPKAVSEAMEMAEEKRTITSMLQDIYMGRRSHEADFLNGEIVELGRKLGIPTPYNSTLLEIINRMFEEGLRPPLYTPAELHAFVRSRAGDPH
ncbi:MAG: 2-dehydropantoate 2-reductase [Acidobacteriota bacterium]